MNRFLELTRKELANLSKYKKIHVVLGNESCDLDSAMSALTYAFYLYKKNVDPDLLPVPMLNIHHEEFPLRTETKYFLNKNNICCANLIFRNNIDLSALKNENRLILTLVDHHVIPKNDQGLKNCVTHIIDHRPINLEEIACKNYKIEPVGSCCTLIGELIIDENYDQKILKEILYLVYGTTILDTVNFNSEAKRFSEKDKKVVEKIEQIFDIKNDNRSDTKSDNVDNKNDNRDAKSDKTDESDKNDQKSAQSDPKSVLNCDLKILHLDRSKIFNELVNARNDISTLTTCQVLQKDMKILDGIPIPGIPLLISEFLKNSDFSDALKNLCKKFNSKITVPMGLKVENSVVFREIGVFSVENCDNCIKNKIVEALKSEKLLELEEISGHKIEGFILFKQNNVKMSRKHIVPILKNVINRQE